MKKIIKKAALMFLVIAIALSSMIFTVSATASSTISFSTSKPKKGESVKVTVNVKADESMYGTQFSVSYDPDILTFVSGEGANGGAGIVNVVGLSAGESTKSYALTFNAIETGESVIQVNSGGKYTNKDEQELDFLGSSAKLTVLDNTKSDNADLKSLSLSAGRISPEFSAKQTEYTATVDNNITECKIYAAAADKDAKISVEGSANLKVGENTRILTVKAPSGKTKSYTIKITRLDENAEVDSSLTENPNEIDMGGVIYTIATDISGVKLPNGFVAAVDEYNEIPISVATDKNDTLKIYYLKQLGTEIYVPCLLNDDGTEFEKMKYATFGENTYIFSDMPKDSKPPEKYYETIITIGDFDVPAYADVSSSTSGFYYTYCFFEDGYRIYRYDKKENVLQRNPEFTLVKKDSELEEELPIEDNFAGRFNSLSSNGKTVVVGIVLLAFALITFIVVIIVRVIKNRNLVPVYEEEEMLFRPDFDEIEIEDGNEAAEGKAKKKK